MSLSLADSRVDEPKQRRACASSVESELDRGKPGRSSLPGGSRSSVAWGEGDLERTVTGDFARLSPGRGDLLSDRFARGTSAGNGERGARPGEPLREPGSVAAMVREDEDPDSLWWRHRGESDPLEISRKEDVDLVVADLQDEGIVVR